MVSPGVPATHPLLQLARKHGVPICGEVHCSSLLYTIFVIRFRADLEQSGAAKGWGSYLHDGIRADLEQSGAAEGLGASSAQRIVGKKSEEEIHLLDF